MVNEKAVDDSAWNESTWHVDEVDCDEWRQVVCPPGCGPCGRLVSESDDVGHEIVECWKVVEHQVALVVVVAE